MLLFGKAQVLCPILGGKACNGGVCVSIVDQHFQFPIDVLIKGLQIGFRRRIVKVAFGIVDLKKVGFYLEGLLDHVPFEIAFHNGTTPATLVIERARNSSILIMCFRQQQPIAIGTVIVQGILIKATHFFVNLGQGGLANVIVTTAQDQKPACSE
jgi:hypothetical protein